MLLKEWSLTARYNTEWLFHIVQFSAPDSGWLVALLGAMPSTTKAKELATAQGWQLSVFTAEREDRRARRATESNLLWASTVANSGHKRRRTMASGNWTLRNRLVDYIRGPRASKWYIGFLWKPVDISINNDLKRQNSSKRVSFVDINTSISHFNGLNLTTNSTKSTFIQICLRPTTSDWKGTFVPSLSAPGY